ncbi:isoflavone reductase family protein [Ustulina deusta]|nr:isoflavone reductase family protein [Ustulina deusta]KAI3338621.1 isoflavone reductase family protein [Ustulina deusta]
MAQAIRNVMLIGGGGLFGAELCATLQKEPSFNLSILSRKSSKSIFPPHLKVAVVDDDYPIDQLVGAFKSQDAVVSAIPGRPYTVHLRMIDAAIQAGVTRFIPSEYGNNTCTAAAELVSLYGDKAKVIAYLKTKENTGLTWTAIHTGQFFDWGLESGWLDYQLEENRATIYDSGNKLWSTTTIRTVATAVVKVLLKLDETKNKPLFVASFTVSQLQVLEALEKATGNKWTISRMTSEEAFEKAKKLDDKDHSEGLKLRILMLLYAEDADRGANFEKDGLLCNKLLDLPEEALTDIIERVVQRKGS